MCSIRRVPSYAFHRCVSSLALVPTVMCYSVFSSSSSKAHPLVWLGWALLILVLLSACSSPTIFWQHAVFSVTSVSNERSNGSVKSKSSCVAIVTDQLARRRGNQSRYIIIIYYYGHCYGLAAPGMAIHFELLSTPIFLIASICTLVRQGYSHPFVIHLLVSSVLHCRYQQREISVLSEHPTPTADSSSVQFPLVKN